MNTELLIILVVIVIVIVMIFSDKFKADIDLDKRRVSVEGEGNRLKDIISRLSRQKRIARKPGRRTWLTIPGNQSWYVDLTHRNDVSLGTGNQNTIRLNSTSGADETQARIYQNGYHFNIYNLSYRVPTIVNGKVVQSRKLRNGDKIRIGKTVFIFRQSP